MTYEEFESILKDIKKSNRADILDYIEEVKTNNYPKHIEDLENDEKLVKATNEILKDDSFVADHVICNSVVYTSLSMGFGMLAASISPIISAIGGKETMHEYLKSVGEIAGLGLLSSACTGYFAYKFHQACYNHKLKKELTNHIKTKFSNQVLRDVEGTKSAKVYPEAPVLPKDNERIA